jgi:protein gp37
MSRLNKSNIDYLDYVWNFYSGCNNWRNGVCKVGEKCWAKQWVHRFKKVYPNDFEPTFYHDAFLEPLKLCNRVPLRIGVGFLGDLFTQDPDMQFKLPEKVEGWVDLVSLKSLLWQVIEACPQHTFVFLTKAYWNLSKWGKFPDNAWVGMSNCNGHEDLSEMGDVYAKVRFVSYEPMYSYTKPDLRHINWVVIGAQTRPQLNPKLEWILDLVEEADNNKCKVFLKNNLMPMLEKFGETNSCAKSESRVLSTLFDANGRLRQEFP